MKPSSEEHVDGKSIAICGLRGSASNDKTVVCYFLVSWWSKKCLDGAKTQYFVAAQEMLVPRIPKMRLSHKFHVDVFANGEDLLPVTLISTLFK
jgi:hypothetical protein